MVTISGHFFGISGLAPGASISSTGVGSKKPSDFRKACCRKGPIISAICAVPTFDDLAITSLTDSKGP